MKPLSRGRLILTRPPFSNAYGHPHRRLAHPSQGQGGGHGQQSEPGDETDGEGQEPLVELDPNGQPVEPDEDGDQEIDVAEAEPEFELDEAPIAPIHLPGLTHKDDRLIVREFDSFYDFVICAADKSLRAWGHDRPGRGTFSTTPDTHNWYLTKSMDEAVDMALNRGWPEGRKLLSDALIAIRARPEPFRAINFDVGGAFPVLPIAIAGDPACMMEFQNDHIATRPVVRIDYDTFRVVSMSTKSIMNYGAAVLSLAMNLEALGHSVELRLFDGSTPHWGYGLPDHRTIVTYKRAGENLDIDRAAFVLAHPSMTRRFGFAILEQSPECAGYGSGHGSHLNNPFGDAYDPLAIRIPHIKKELSLDEARKVVEKAAASWLEPKEIAA